MANDEVVAFSMYHLRPAEHRDLSVINAYAFMEGMDNIPDTDNVYIAASQPDIPLGFVRYVPSEKEEGVGFINPIVVNDVWRGYGMGRELMKKAEAQFNEIRLVARGESVAFYKHLGYKEIPWEKIETNITENCDGCKKIEHCKPLPMGKIIEK